MADFVVLTGPGCRRVLKLQDGAEYDCATPLQDLGPLGMSGVVEVQSEAHQQELMHLVSLHYHHHGHPLHGPEDPPFVYNAELAPEAHREGYEPHPDNNLSGL